MAAKDTATLRELAARYAELCAQPEMEQRRDVWRRHNSLKRTRASDGGWNWRVR